VTDLQQKKKILGYSSFLKFPYDLLVTTKSSQASILRVKPVRIDGLCLFLHLIEYLEGGLVGVFECDGDEAALAFKLGYLVVVAVLGHVGPCAEFFLQLVANLLPHSAGAVVGREQIVLLQNLQGVVVLSH